MPHRSFPLSEGVRGTAAMAIIVVHVWLVTATYSEALLPRMLIRLDVVVSLFFMLSAFLLYRPMIAHRAGGPRGPSVGDYARRRFFRIYPTYWVALTCLAVFPGLAGVFSSDWWSFYSLSVFYQQGAVAAQCPEVQLCGLPQTWTLVTEITFYAILPLYAALAALLFSRAGRRGTAAELAAIAVLIACSMALYVLPGFPHDAAWFRFSFLGHFDWLGLGLALAVLSVALERRPRLPPVLGTLASRPALAFGGALAVYLLMVFALPPIPFPLTDDMGHYLAMHLGHATIATLVMVPVVFGDPNVGRVRRFLGHPAMVWLGLVSYGVYLWHFSIAYYLGVGGAEASFGPALAMTFALAIPLGAMSWYLVERPMMRLKYRRRSPRRVAKA